MSITRRDTILGGIAMALAPQSAMAQTRILGGPAFGSTWRLVSGAVDATSAIPLITARIAAIDAALSPYRATSAISRFNRASVGETLEIPDPMARVVSAALQVSRDTHGAFDPTMGPLVARFGYGPIVGEASSVDNIDLRGVSLRKTAPGLTLDLCGIAKGYALDCITADLVAQGATSFLLELGGEVRTLGTHPSGRPWQVAIEDPASSDFAAHTIVAPGALALATSGHRANGLMGTVALSHVINPRTSRPATGFAASISVLAATGMQADAMATALLAIGEGGPDFARQHDIPALFILASPHSTTRITTGQFNTHIIA